jgi:hypothetical protein
MHAASADGIESKGLMPLFLAAWPVCGALDIGYAILTSWYKYPPLVILQGVASGPFGDNVDRLGWLGGLLGLGVHFTIMAAMVAVFCLVVARYPRLISHAVVAGLIYGAILYVVMYWIVLPIRYPTEFPQTNPVRIGKALLPHLLCVGLPLGLLTQRLLKGRLARPAT